MGLSFSTGNPKFKSQDVFYHLKTHIIKGCGSDILLMSCYTLNELEVVGYAPVRS